jgi:hypothetical protein
MLDHSKTLRPILALTPFIGILLWEFVVAKRIGRRNLTAGDSLVH